MSEVNNTVKEMTEEEKERQRNYNICKATAHELEEYYNGNFYHCDECGGNVETTENENGEKIICTECNSVIDDDNQLSLYDYFNINDIYNIDYVVGSDKTFRGVILMIACGGPNIYIDTFRQLVRLHWWADYADFPIWHEISDEIDEIFKDKCRYDLGIDVD